MLITREIDGKIVQFELTAAEMEAGYDEQYRKTPNWFGQVRWCNADLIAALEEKGYPASEHNISELRCRCEHHSFTDSMIQEGWGTIYCILEDLANEGNLQEEDVHQEEQDDFRQYANTFRVVLDCYDADDPRPYADFIDKLFQSEEDAQKGVEEAVKQELETLNQCEIPDIEDCDHLPFRASIQAEDAATVRMWDGDDYRIVTRYNIYRVNEHLAPGEFEKGISYRGYCLFLKDGQVFIGEVQTEKPYFMESWREKDLDNALHFVDILWLEARQRNKKRKE